MIRRVEEGRLNGYEPDAWFEFGVGIIGAAAALAGLLFVAMSINIERILALPKLPSRAGGNVVLFVLPLLLGHMAGCAWTGHDRTRIRGARNRIGVRGTSAVAHPPV
jgi:hypothetical protein